MSSLLRCRHDFLFAHESRPLLPPASTVFFPLHTLVDDAHQHALLEIAADLAKTPDGLAALEVGMLKALQLRTAFWDWLYERALNPSQAEAVT